MIPPYNQEDEDDERNWDDDTYEIVVSTQSHIHLGPRPEAEKFVKWLRIRGHDAKLGVADIGENLDTIDGYWTQNSNEARDVFEGLWTRFADR